MSGSRVGARRGAHSRGVPARRVRGRGARAPGAITRKRIVTCAGGGGAWTRAFRGASRRRRSGKAAFLGQGHRTHGARGPRLVGKGMIAPAIRAPPRSMGNTAHAQAAVMGAMGGAWEGGLTDYKAFTTRNKVVRICRLADRTRHISERVVSSLFKHGVVATSLGTIGVRAIGIRRDRAECRAARAEPGVRRELRGVQAEAIGVRSMGGPTTGARDKVGHAAGTLTYQAGKIRMSVASVAGGQGRRRRR
jgi:hypothetical protein